MGALFSGHPVSLTEWIIITGNVLFLGRKLVINDFESYLISSVCEPLIFIDASGSF